MTLLALEGTPETMKAIEKLEFIVGSDFIMTPMMELSDFDYIAGVEGPNLVF